MGGYYISRHYIRMKLIIHRETRVEDIQQSFNSYYPFLRIQFYSPSHPKDGLAKATPLSGKLSDILFRETSHLTLDIHSAYSIAAIEDSCRAMGLQALISRKGGSVWVEILLTKNWSLDQQNKAGAALCGGITD